MNNPQFQLGTHLPPNNSCHPRRGSHPGRIGAAIPLHSADGIRPFNPMEIGSGERNTAARSGCEVANALDRPPLAELLGEVLQVARVVVGPIVDRDSREL